MRPRFPCDLGPKPPGLGFFFFFFKPISLPGSWIYLRIWWMLSTSNSFFFLSFFFFCVQKPFPGGSLVENSPANVGEAGWIPGWGRAPGAGNGNPLQYSCLGNPTDRGAWRATVHGVPKSQTPASS